MRRSTGRDFLDRCVKNLVQAVVTYGAHWVHIPSLAEQRQGPGPGHPERLRPDVPLSDLERRLLRDMGALPELF